MPHTDTESAPRAAHTDGPGGQTVDFWFDPLCPFAWITSRWVLEAAERLPLTLRWHEMSLALLNSGPEVPEARRALLGRYWGPVRLIAAAREAHGDEVVGPLYTALGNRFHGAGGIFEPVRTAADSDFREAMHRALDGVEPGCAEALAELGLPSSLLAALDSEEWDERLRASHDRVPDQDLGRELIGVPTISVDGGPGQFGPVLSAIPRGKRAAGLWTAFATLAADPDFFELKQSTGRTAPVTD
ncbi:DsbA family oxidoreductase [Streptomyces sp. NPDC054904]|uniref:DsbA family oxidoreductase n=1 Tax=Streptomyces sp. NPDC090054 TaxID=3365933 RepID=UPI0037F920DE